MNAPNWNKKYELGVPDIDFQHKYFLELIHRFVVKTNEGMDDKMLVRHFNEIVKYAHFHFYSEENIMMLNNYPDLEIHHEQHMVLIDQLSSRINYFETGKYSIGDISRFMIDWFIEHTVQEDKKFALYLSEKGK